MKTQILILIALVLTLFSCTDDDESSGDIAPISIKFNLKTDEDQMGKFTSNAMVVFNDKVWSVAGYNNDASHPFANNEVWKSDNGINWVSVTSNVFEPRTGHSLTVFDDKMWLIGGTNNLLSRLSDVWYSSDGFTWILATDTPAFGTVSNHSTVVFDDKLLLIEEDNVWSSADGINWDLEVNSIFSSRFYHRAVVFDAAIYVIGGGDGSVYFNEIWKSSDVINWTPVTTTLPIFSPIIHHTATVYNGKVWVIGGTWSTGSDSNEIWVSSDMMSWQKYDGSIPFGVRSSHVNLLFEDVLWLFGGFSPTGISGAIWTIKEE